VTTSIVQLDLLGQSRELEVVEDDPVPAHWGEQSLRRVHFGLRVASDDEHDALNAELGESLDGPAILAGSGSIQWMVTSHSYSYTDNEPPLHHIELTERQQLSLDRVEFDGLALIPDRSSLSESGDAVVEFLVNMSAEQHQKFETILQQHRGADVDRYFPVSLVGIAEQPVRMRFGRCLWQDLGDAGVRHLIVLVADEEDEQSQSPGFEQLMRPAQDRLMAGALNMKRRLDALIAELQRANVLDEAAVGRIIDEANRYPTSPEVREFERADDVDEFF
jgi:hypothetical protein